MHSKRNLFAMTLLSSAVALACSSGGGSTHSLSGALTGAAAVTLSLSGASTASATTDGSGYYSFGGLANGNYRVTPSLAGYTFSPASLAVTVNGGDVTGQNFVADPIATTFDISGRVTGATGVTVAVSGASTASATTDGSGFFSISGLANGSYKVTPSKTGYIFAPASRDVAVSGANKTEQNFTANLVTHMISGTVAGASGVTVALSGASIPGATTETVQSGSYSFSGLVDGTYTVTPSKTGYTFSPASSDVAVNGADATVPEFTATRITYSISGTVTGTSVSGVRVTLGSAGANPQSALTDDSGNYRFNGLVDGSYTVIPGKTGYTYSPTTRDVSVSGADTTVTAFVATINTYRISGTVSGASVVDVLVTLTASDTRTTAADPTTGAYGFIGLLNGSYTVTPSKIGLVFSPANALVKVAEGDATAPNFVASVATYTVSGTLSIAGSLALVPGATVTLKLSDGSGSEQATTSNQAAGAYTFARLANGTYVVTPSKANFTFSPPTSTVVVNYADMGNQNFAASPVGTLHAISGAVTGASTVNLTLFGPITAYSTSDAEGRYSFPGLIDGTYRVTPSKTGRAFSPANLEVAVSAADVTLQDFKAGQWVVQDLGAAPTIRPTATWGDWAVSSGGTILHWTGTSWARVTSSPTTSNLHGVWGSGLTDIWAVGDGGTILHGDGADDGWRDVSKSDGLNPLTASLHGVSGIGSEVWVVGQGGVILRRSGGVWSRVATPASLDWEGVWVGAADDIWIVGWSGNIWQRTGARWQNRSVFDLATEGLGGVWGSGPDNVWIVGNSGKILHWDGNSVSYGLGTNVEQGLPTSESLNSVWGSGPNDVWAVGANGAILHWDGRGFDAWRTCASPADPAGLACAAWQDVGKNGLGGDTNAAISFSGVWGSGPNDVRAVGIDNNANAGTILGWQ
jgi:hypothetical protein